MLREDSKLYNYQHCYQPNVARILLTKVAKLFIYIFRLNTNSVFANEVAQNTRNCHFLTFEENILIFKTGHNRLKWRAETFYQEEPLMIDWLKTFEKKDVFLDLGANVGIYSIPAASKGATVFSIELDPINVSILFSNIFLNNFSHKITLLPFAAGAEKKIDIIFYRDFSVGDALQSVGREQVLTTHRPNPFSTNQIVMPVDCIFDEYRLPQPTKIKIDVDGNEKIVFDGGEKTILKAQEIYYEDSGSDDDTYIIEKILGSGFKIAQQAAFSGNVGKARIRSDVADIKIDRGTNILFKKI